MGIIAGLIGVSIIANAVSDTVVGKQREKEQAKVQAERIRAEKEIKAAKIQSKALVKMAKINAQSEVAQTGMKTGFFASLFGMNSGQRTLGNNNGWGQTGEQQYIPQSPTSYLPHNSSSNHGNVGSYSSRGSMLVGDIPMYCRYCGTKHDPDALFCVRCGRDLD